MTEQPLFIWATPTRELAPTPLAASLSHPPLRAMPRGHSTPVTPGTPQPSERRRASSRGALTSRLLRIVAAVGAVWAGTACRVADAKPVGSSSDSASGGGAAAPAPVPPAAPAMRVEVSTARAVSLAEEVPVAGRIEAVQAIALRPEVDGRIVAIVAAEGQPVRKGAPLFRIDDGELTAQVARATAERDLAIQALERSRGLLAQQASTQADLERAEALARTAQAQVDLLTLRLARTTVRAPFSGVMGRRMVSLGDMVSPQVPLASMHTVHPQQVTLSVPERYAASLKVGQPVSFTVAAFPGEQFTARVTFVDPMVLQPGRTITVKALAPNREGKLDHGMFADARLTTATRASAVLIPEAALMPGAQGGHAVWVVVNERAKLRVVTLGVRRAGDVEVRSGLKAGEQVVVGGVLQLADDAPVAPVVLDRADTSGRL